jgi:hypothetical protein
MRIKETMPHLMDGVDPADLRAVPSARRVEWTPQA